MNPEEKMHHVLELANTAIENGEMPIAAAIYHGDELISSAYTTDRSDGRWLVHAEQKALMDADMQKLPIEVRKKLELYTNLEPCLMCLGMAMSSFVDKIFYSLEAPEDGAIDIVRKGFESRKVSGLSAYRFPEVAGGLLRNESICLFRKFVEINEGKAPTAFAKSLAVLTMDSERS